MGQVLELDCSAGSGNTYIDLTASPYTGVETEVWVQFDAAFNPDFIIAATSLQSFLQVQDSTGNNFLLSLDPDGSGGFNIKSFLQGAPSPPFPDYAPPVPITSFQFYHFKVQLIGHATTPTVKVWMNSTVIGSFTGTASFANVQFVLLDQTGALGAGALEWFDNFRLGTTNGGSDLASDDFEGAGPAPDAAIWIGSNNASLTADPGVVTSTASGRVFIAFDDGPLVADPTWTRIDGSDNAPFPANFVSGYDVQSGRQTLISQTDTGTATVYINDHETALFDPRNHSSPYFGKLDGRQILLQLYDPVAAAWEDQFRGLIDDITWDIDGSAVGEDSYPINASIQIDCVDMFDYLAGYGLTPGLDGVTPPVGAEDGVYYAATAGSVDDRIIEILTDVGIDSTRYTVASGNVHVKAVKYDPDESALQALRDAADAELPFIANIYCDRHGDFQFRGRYSRFVPDSVAAEPGSTWDFTRWAVGDGASILADPARAQMRLLSFVRNRSDLINVAIAYPQDMPAADMPGQVWADSTSITAYGKHSAPPMSDLLTDTSDVGGLTDIQETALYAELLVKNQKDPVENVSALQVKAIQPDDPRAAVTWALLTRADISHIIGVEVGYPEGTGLGASSPDDDYYIEGRHLRVRPANSGYDYVECDYDLSPAVWSMDTHNVFPAFS